jgi:hypothetical protein
MELSAFGVVQVAVAVFGGHLLAFVVARGFRILENDEPHSPIKYLAYAVPFGLLALVLIGSSSPP